MSADTIAYRYASALFDLIADGEREHIEGVLKMLAEVFLAQPAFVDALCSPVVSAEKKETVLLKVLNEIEPPGIISDFMRVLLRKRRFDLYAAVVRQYSLLLKESRNVAAVTVRSAFQLTHAQEAAIQNKMQQLLHKKTVLTVTVDASLLAGIAVRVNDEQYEFSLRNDLCELGRQLSQVS